MEALDIVVLGNILRIFIKIEILRKAAQPCCRTPILNRKRYSEMIEIRQEGYKPYEKRRDPSLTTHCMRHMDDAAKLTALKSWSKF